MLSVLGMARSTITSLDKGFQSVGVPKRSEGGGEVGKSEESVA